MDIKNNSGIVDKIRFSSLQDYIEKILKIKTKYDLPSITFNIDENTDIAFDDENGVCYILINKCRIIKYSYHHSFNNVKVVISAGALNNAVHFVTENKSYKNKQIIKELEAKLKNYIPALEKELYCKKRNGMFYDIYCQLNSIEFIRKKYDVKPNENEKMKLDLNDKISLVFFQNKKFKLSKSKDNYWFICVNDKPIYGYRCGESPIASMTSNEEVNSQEYVDKISEIISANIDEIKKWFSDYSKEKYSLE